MRDAVSRTRESFSAKISDIAALTRTVDESALDNLEVCTAHERPRRPHHHRHLDALRDRARHQAIEGGAELRDLLKEQLIAILRAPQHAVPAPAAPPKSHFPRRRQRHRQNHFERQARRLVSCTKPLRPSLRRRHLPRRRHRAARNLGPSLRRRNDQDKARAATPLPSSTTPSPPPNPAPSTISTSTLPAACTPNPASWTSSTRCAAPLPASSPARPTKCSSSWMRQQAKTASSRPASSRNPPASRHPSHQARWHRQGRHRRRHRPRTESPRPLRRRRRKNDRPAGILAGRICRFAAGVTTCEDRQTTGRYACLAVDHSRQIGPRDLQVRGQAGTVKPKPSMYS
jgi:hypothetical protein